MDTIVYFVAFLFGILIIIVSMFLIFTKAGRNPIASIIPIWGQLEFLEIINRPRWWVLLPFLVFIIDIIKLMFPIISNSIVLFLVIFILLLNIYYGIVSMIDLGKSFCKSKLFIFGLVILPFIFIPILATDDSKYEFIVRKTLNDI
ncbi:MAG: DUF5684 domain-containing protein [Candidatus Kapabacteria bacterium]|nr:DUF5684 domain-containing protein [Candidatus Kapabacteria bacterium]